MKWLKRIGIAFGVLLLVLAAIPFFVSLNDYIPQIEKEASERLKDPVRIKSLRLAFLPLPHVTADGITVGKGNDLTVGKVTVTPDLWSLLGATRVIKNIEVDGLVITQAAIDRLSEWTKPDPKAKRPPKDEEGPPAVRVESIKLDDAIVKLAKATFGPFDARLRLTDTGAVEDASIVGRDGKLKAFVKPQGKGAYMIDATAKAWKVPAEPALLFDELTVKGVATLKNANLEDIRAKLYGGTVTGKAAVGWEKGIQLKGNLEVSHMEIKSLLQALGRPPTLSGRLTARPVFSANASRADQLAGVLRLETPFDVQNGVLHGIDISKAATSFISKDGAKGGETRFDRLSGHLVMERGTRRFTSLNIASGSLSADGNVTVSPKDELSGRINAKVAAAKLASASVPLNVTGTVQSPMLFPTGGSMAGAAIGTAIGGPLGTGVGAKVGQWAEGLFGKKEGSK